MARGAYVAISLLILDPKLLAEAMLSPDNIPMLDTKARAITNADVLDLAHRTLAVQA